MLAVFCFATKASILLSVELTVVAIIEIASLRVRPVTVVLLFKFSVRGVSIAVCLLATFLFATVLAGIGSLVAVLFEVCSATGVYWLLLHEAFLVDTGCSLMLVG